MHRFFEKMLLLFSFFSFSFSSSNATIINQPNTKNFSTNHKKQIEVYEMKKNHLLSKSIIKNEKLYYVPLEKIINAKNKDIIYYEPNKSNFSIKIKRIDNYKKSSLKMQKLDNLSEIGLQFDLKTKRLYENKCSNEIKNQSSSIKIRTLKQINDLLKNESLPFFVLLKKTKKEKRIFAFKTKTPFFRINVILNEFHESENNQNILLINMTINIDSKTIILRNITIQTQDFSFENLSFSNNNKNFSQNFIVKLENETANFKKNGKLALKMKTILNSFFSIKKTLNLKASQQKRKLQTTPFYIISPVNSQYSSNPNCSMNVSKKIKPN